MKYFLLYFASGSWWPGGITRDLLIRFPGSDFPKVANYSPADVSLTLKTLQPRLVLLRQVHLGLGEAGPVHHHLLVEARQSGQPEDGVDGVSLDSGVGVLLALVLDLHLQLAGQVDRGRTDGSEAHHQLDARREF